MYSPLNSHYLVVRLTVLDAISLYRKNYYLCGVSISLAIVFYTVLIALGLKLSPQLKDPVDVYIGINYYDIALHD